MKLITLADFVLQSNDKGTDKEVLFDRCVKYAKFLQQDLELSMFMEVDSDSSKIIFKNLTFDKPDYISDVKLYMVDNVQVFNLSEDGEHLYWHYYVMEDLLRESDDIELIDGLEF